ncbi:hypothetical protein H6S82_20875 [Planktothrix sp. FACHB-1355]|uniref:hypothetical protein n=1 Tax=Planktothrix sp. FACHB-1355 TaxID=2692854 RepID=UPI00168A486A|nr:hypothetical protein [Planktothrix sp. FACHB-1355]MBD3561275.1 hypothetical protein [Planktothrix sp. FACHB-1355]
MTTSDSLSAKRLKLTELKVFHGCTGFISKKKEPFHIFFDGKQKGVKIEIPRKGMETL